jgi:excisionase family DNA binding protein
MAETVTLPGSAAARPTPETVSVEAAASRLGIGRSLAYELARQGKFPVPVVRVGRRILVPTRPLDRLLGGAEVPASAMVPAE